MSYDFKTLRVCKHKVEHQRVYLGLDGLTINFNNSVGSDASVKLYVNGQLIPRQGLVKKQSIKLNNKSIYTFTSKRNKLKIDINGTIVDITFPSRRLNKQDLYSILWKNLKDYVIITDDLSIGQKHIDDIITFVDPRHSDKLQLLDITKNILNTLNHLGISPGKRLIRKKVFPPWDIVQNTTPTSQSNRMIRLAHTYQNTNAIIELSYVTVPRECKRCFGLGYEFDYGYKGNGYEIVSGTELMMQEFDKFLFTEAGSHFKWRWLGTEIINRIGSKNISYLIDNDVHKAFSTYKSIKSQQLRNFPFQNVSDSEYPQSLTQLTFSSDPNDPTITRVNIVLSNNSFEYVNTYKLIDSFGNVSYYDDYLLRG